MRTAHIERKTKESEVLVELNLDGHGLVDISTGVPFFDHMLSQLGKHSGFNLRVKTTGDVDVDSHHTVEDTSLALGRALKDRQVGDEVTLQLPTMKRKLRVIHLITIHEQTVEP